MLVQLVGILLFVYAIPLSILGFTKEHFVQSENKKSQSTLSAKSIIVIATAFGRVSLILVGLILFAYGKHLPSMVQFAVVLLSSGIIVESLLDASRDYIKWRTRIKSKK